MAIELRLAMDGVGDSLWVASAVGREAMNRIASWSVRIVVPEPIDGLDDLLGKVARLAILHHDEGSTRTIELVARGVAEEGADADGVHYAIELASPPFPLTLERGHRIFLDKTTKEIVSDLWREAGLPADRLVWRLTASHYEKRLQCVQYGESEWGFVERLLAEEGVNYWFDFDDDKGGTLVLGDAAGGHDGLAPTAEVLFSDPEGLVAPRGVYELEVSASIAPTGTMLRDVDVRNPDVYIEGSAGEGPYVHFEYPAWVLTSAVAAERAKVRLEQVQRYAARIDGRSNVTRLVPGRVFDLQGCADAAHDVRYLVTEIEHRFAAPRPGNGNESGYENRFAAVPHPDGGDGRLFRPAAPVRAPRADGVEAAITTGPGGEEIHVDDLGRLKLRFLWDRSGITDDRSSYWTRSMQMNLAGAMLTPRVGWEVPVAYVDGNPDRPIVLARSYNATAIVPYGLPGGKATTTLQSATSPGGGSTNELRMGDSAGGMEMFLHASRDQSVIVGGSATSTVSSNETHDVGLALEVGIGSSQSLTVGASQSVDVGTDKVIEVDGSRSEMIGGMEMVKVTGNRTVTTPGAYSELIGGAYAIQCNQSNTKVGAAFTNLVGGPMLLTGGLGYSESVAAARTELVGGSASLTIGFGYGDTVRGVKAVTAGSVKESSDGPVSTKGKASGTIQVGGTARFTAGSELVLEAPSITIEVAGTLTAGDALKLAGGAVQPKSGTTKLKGTITRKSGTKID